MRMRATNMSGESRRGFRFPQAGKLTRNALIWPILMPAWRQLLWNVARAQIGPDKREKTGQTA
jgi:hypothetical protein